MNALIHHGPYFDLLHDGRDYVASQVVQHGFFDAYLKTVYDTWLLPHHTVIEVGAHIGTHTVYIARRVPRGHVYAIEPQRTLWLNLCANVWLNECENVTPVHGACYSDSCTLAAQLSETPYPANEYKASIAFAPVSAIPAAASTLSSTPPSPLTIRASCLDTFVDGLSTPVDFLKIDCEGADWEVALGAMRTIRRDRPVIIFEDNAGQIVQWTHALLPLGYHIVRMTVGNYIAFTAARADDVEAASRATEK